MRFMVSSGCWYAFRRVSPGIIAQRFRDLSLCRTTRPECACHRPAAPAGRCRRGFLARRLRRVLRRNTTTNEDAHMGTLPLRNRRATFLVIAGIAALFLSPIAAAEIYRCEDGGRVVYSDRPCV